MGEGGECEAFFQCTGVLHAAAGTGRISDESVSTGFMEKGTVRTETETQMSLSIHIGSMQLMAFSAHVLPLATDLGGILA